MPTTITNPYKITELTIGADPEVFVRKGDKWLSGHHIVLGTKEKPLKTIHGAIQNDGLALEFNVLPSKTKVQFIRNFRGVLDDLMTAVTDQDGECYIVPQSSVVFGMDYINALPDAVKELGCNPDWDAYNLAENERPNGETGMRTGGGHVHIGWTEGADTNSMLHICECAEIAKQLDYTLGLYSLNVDTDTLRRKMYGRAGAFRPKPYGMEYRSLSNFWIKSEQLIGNVYDRTMMAFRLMNQGVYLDHIFDGFAQETINTDVFDWREKAPKELKDYLL